VITATKAFTGVLRIALTPPEPQAAALLDKCQNVYPIGGTAKLDLQNQKYSNHVYVILSFIVLVYR